MKNPLIEINNQPYNSVPFSNIKSEHFLPAIKHFIEVTESNINKICNNNNSPNFNNTIVLFETSQEDLDYVVGVYQHLFGSEADEKIRNLITQINPLLTKLSNDIYLNKELFRKIKFVYDSTDKNNYSKDDLRLINETYNYFIRNGSNLSENHKTKYREISQELSLLSPKFSDNVLKATNKINNYWITNEKDLDGIPSSSVDAAKHLANLKNRKEDWCFSLDTNFPVIMKYCKNRLIRKEVLEIMGSKCNGGEYDNSDILQNISKLRHEKATLLGYDTHADYVLDRRMAKNKDNVYKLINDLIDPSYKAAENELKIIKDFAVKQDSLNKLEPWDTAYYSEQFKQDKYNFDDECLRVYFKAENVISGVFEVANRLYGLSFKKLDNVQVYHEDVKVYEVTDSNHDFVGLLYEDLHPRPTKRNGAWMNQLRSQGLFKNNIQRPHVTFNCNLTKSTDNKPALLTLGEVRTIFHEFGHCLHGLLTNVTYQSLGGMHVYWDFVELPSQIFENWLTESDVLKLFAKHYETGELLPQEYIDKINDLKRFMAGSLSLRQLQLCKIDMAWHDGCKKIDDIEKFESDLLSRYRLMPNVSGNAISTSFSHIFAGGYSAGYYSYKWAELLEADAFEKFKNDGIFNITTAASFKNNILSKGNTDHPMNLYKNFRGREPKVDALLKKGGLSK